MWTEEEKKALLKVWPGGWNFARPYSASIAKLGLYARKGGEGDCAICLVKGTTRAIVGVGPSWKEAKEEFASRLLPEHRRVKADLASLQRVKDSLKGRVKSDG